MAEKIVKVVTKLAHRFNSGIIVDGITVKFDREGVAELIPEQAFKVVNREGSNIEMLDIEDISKIVPETVSKEEYTKLLESITEYKNGFEELSEEVKRLRTELIEKDEDLEKKDKEIDRLSKVNIKLEEQLKKTVQIKPDKGKGKKGKVEENPFDSLELDDCVVLCKESNFPEEEWKDLEIEAMHKYLLEKDKEQQSNE